MLTLDALRGTISAGVILGLFPILWWVTVGRKKEGFARSFGLIWPKPNGKSAGIAVGVYFIIWAAAHLPVFTRYTQPSASVYAGMGGSAIVPAFIVAFLQNGFWEEFLFRGFISKRLIRIFGEKIGIVIQAAIFGGVHLLLASEVTFLSGIIIFVTTAVGGLMLGYIAEQSFNGSILPGCVLHGIGNFIVILGQAFP